MSAQLVASRVVLSSTELVSSETADTWHHPLPVLVLGCCEHLRDSRQVALSSAGLSVGEF
jgi:hypothetical protein